MFMTACSCKLVLPACWPHAGMQLRAACVVFLPCLRFLGMCSGCCWHVKTCLICHVYSRPSLALACLWRLARASLSDRHVGLTQVCSYVLPASSSCHVCGLSACLVRVPNYIVLSPYNNNNNNDNNDNNNNNNYNNNYYYYNNYNYNYNYNYKTTSYNYNYNNYNYNYNNNKQQTTKNKQQTASFTAIFAREPGVCFSSSWGSVART